LLASGIPGAVSQISFLSFEEDEYYIRLSLIKLIETVPQNPDIKGEDYKKLLPSRFVQIIQN